jgi:hypothetical protein
MKKHYAIYFLALFVVFFATTSFVFADTAASGAAPTGNFVALTQIPAITAIGTGGVATLTSFFNNIYKYCVGIAAALAVLMIAYAGFTWMSAGDNTEKISQAKKRIQDAIFGLVLVLSPTINPNVLNLSLDFGHLAPSSTDAGAAPAGTPSTGTASTPTAASCNDYTTIALGTGSCTAPLTQIDSSCCSLGSGQVCCGSK